MSSFSSVVRKPGQKITPKVAPRRAIQRNVQKSTPTVETLTPESLSQSPSRPDSPPTQDPAQSTDNNEPAIQSVPTPPPTAVNIDNATATEQSNQPFVPDAQEEIQPTSPVRRREDTVPLVATSQISPGAVRTRRASAVQREAQAVADINKVSHVPAKDQEPIAEPPAKRRRISVQVPDEVIDPQLRDPVPSIQPPAITAPRRANNDLLATDALLQQVSSSARAISDLANSIERRTQRSQSRTARLSASNDDSDYQQSRSPSSQSYLERSRSSAIQKAAAAVVAQAVRGGNKTKSRHRRGHTPEDAEHHKIDEANTSMSDLLIDTGLGQRSTIGKRLDTEWAEIKSRWDYKLEQNRAKAKLKPSQRKITRDSQPQNGEEVVAENQTQQALAPKLMVINGQLAIAEESRQVDLSSNLVERVNAVVEADVQNEERIYNYVNQNRIGKHAGLRTNTRWDTELTDKFYQGLRMFGTDFELISSLFGGDWTRRQIKAKFVREERANIDKVKAALAAREQVNLSGYGTLTGTATSGLRDPKEIQAEIDAEEKRIRDEYEKAKNGGVGDLPVEENEADMPIESIETDALLAVGADGEAVAADRASVPAVTPSENRFSALADKIVKRAGQPATAQQKKQTALTQQRKQREQTGTSRAGTGVGGGRKSARGKKPLEGVEERIGNVGDVEL